MRKQLEFLFVLTLVAWFGGAIAQDYPNKPVRIVVPYAAGGLPDTMTRIVSQRLIETFGQQFIIDNRPGAGGIAACELVANTLKRSAQAPDVPTVAEVTGIRDFDYPPEIGVLAPAGTPKDIEPVGNTPEAYAAQIRIDIEKYAKAVKISGVKLD